MHVPARWQWSFLSRILFLVVPVILFHSCREEEHSDPDPVPEFAVEIGDSEIPYIVIDTRGTGILNEPKVPAEMVIYENKTEVHRAGIGIEYRGSTSFRISDKKSFGIETWDEAGKDTDVSFFGFPAEEDWILSGHIVNLGQGYIFDQTLMYNYFGYELYRKMGNYAARTEFVELEINGGYQGVYVFMEKLKRDVNRIDVATLDDTDSDPAVITGGYILKIDKTSGGDHNLNQPLEYFLTNWDDDARYNGEISFRSRYDIYGNLLDFEPFGPPYHPDQYLETYFLYEYPDAAAITDSQKTYIREYIDAFETALLKDDFSSATRSYTGYIDQGSFVDYFILNELVRNVDGYRLSTYLQKDRGGKLAMGPVWDLDIGYYSGDRVPFNGWVINYNQYVERDAWMMPFWWPRLMEDPLFREAVKVRWNSLRSGVLSTASLMGMVDQAAGYLQENGAVQRNYERWNPGWEVDYEGSLESLKQFLTDRAAWMDGAIGAF